MKYWIIISLLALAGCGDTEYRTIAQDSGLNGGEGEKQKNELTVKTKSGSWNVQSAIGVSQFGMATIYFIKEEGFNCGRLSDLAKIKSFVTLTLPSKEAKYDLKSASEIAQSGFSGAFSNTLMDSVPFETLNLKVDSVEEKTIAGQISATSAKGYEIKGQFEVEICN